MTHPITVRCQPADEGWRCAITVGHDPGATHHEVDVVAADLERLDPGADHPEALVRAAFEFLLTECINLDLRLLPDGDLIDLGFVHLDLNVDLGHIRDRQQCRC